MKKWAANLLVVMKQNGITQRELAEKLGVTYQYVSMVFNNKINIKTAEQRFTKAVDEIIAANK